MSNLIREPRPGKAQCQDIGQRARERPLTRSLAHAQATVLDRHPRISLGTDPQAAPLQVSHSLSKPKTLPELALTAWVSGCPAQLGMGSLPLRLRGIC